MGASEADACAAIVARDDPHLHATALFAPEPRRWWLMVLYAFDIEFGRAAAASTEPLIARMRLAWWRDVVEGANAGAALPAHEVAGPVSRLLRERGLPADKLEALIAARENELEGGFDEDRFARWADGRFGALTALAAHLLTDGHAPSIALARRSAPVLGTAFALRHAAATGGGSRLLPEPVAGRAGQGEPPPMARAAMGARAAQAMAVLAELRAGRARVDRRAVPAFLPLVRAGRILARASRPGVGLRDLDGVDGPFEGLRLAWAAATGLW